MSAKFPDVPPGMVALGPWFPFAAYGLCVEGTVYQYTVYRRPLKWAETREGLVSLASLPAGSLFEYAEGQFVKTCKEWTLGEWVCVSLDDGTDVYMAGTAMVCPIGE
ncbi:MAG: hypothetical protein FJ034_08085 [Chloroflexi bacterium]|nr:hypothetical protein [Chloroflexota bacterium]